MSKILKNCPFIGTFSATGKPYYISESELRSNPHIGLINHVVYKDHFKTASEYFYANPKKKNKSTWCLHTEPINFVDIAKKLL